MTTKAISLVINTEHLSINYARDLIEGLMIDGFIFIKI